MCYKIFFIIIIMLNGLFTQSFFNKVIGDEIGFQSARSFAIGHTHFMNSNTSALALRNPAQLAFIKDRVKIDFNLTGLMVNERRAIDLKDYFGDFLVEGDYVSNNTFNNYNQIGFTTSFELFFMSFGAAVSHGPWSSLDYKYEEEVRGSESFDDGIIGIRDPIIGYHILEHQGTIDLTSFGLAFGINERISIGASFNQFHKGSHGYEMKVTQISDSNENLASIENINESIDFKEDNFLSLSAILIFNKTDFSVGYEGNAFIESDDSFENSISNTLGLPIYIDDSNISLLKYSSKGVFIEKPEKIKMGINHHIGSNKNYRLFAFEVIKNKFSTNTYYNDYMKINLGIEYINRDKVFRLGLSYKTPSFEALSPLTTFSFGTSKTYNSLIFDVSASYSYQNYHYSDLFSVDGDVRPDYDNVHESAWSLVSTISYSF